MGGVRTFGFYNAGQDCTAATRVLAGPGVFEDFASALAEQAKNTKTGDPDDPDVLYGRYEPASDVRVARRTVREARSATDA